MALVDTIAIVPDETASRISVYARKFGVMNEMVVPRSVFLQPQPVRVRSDDPDCWKTEESACLGLIAELYEELPSDMHEMMQKHTSFRDTVHA
jgi:hypothetical protein